MKTNKRRPSRAAEPANRVCVLVLAMHRSGTSATTRVLNLLGVTLGSDLLERATDNTRGFWEQRAVVEMHERLLAGLERTWGDPRPLPAGWLESEAATQATDEIEAILDGFTGERMFAIKDPRLCQFVELWLTSLRQRGIRPVVVFVVRHPLEVAESIHVRDGWSREQCWLMWSRSTIEAVAATSQLERCVVGYDTLLDDWRMATANAAGQLQLEWPLQADTVAEAVDAFLHEGERHHHSQDIPDSDVPDHLLAIYQALRRIEQGESWTILDKFAELHEDFKISTVALHQEQAKLDSHEGPPARSVGAVQIFYRTSDQSHAEERSRTLQWPAASNVSSFVFRFHETIEIDALRIDFDDFPGVFLLDRLEIDGQLIDVPSRVTARHGMVLGDGVASTVGLVAADHDPWIEVDVAGTRCRKVSASITRIPLNDAVHTMRTTLDLHQRLEMLIQRVASSGDCILANQRAGQERATQWAQQAVAAVDGQSGEIGRLEQHLLGSAEAASRLDERVIAAGQQLDAIADGQAGHGSRFDAGIGAVAQQLERIVQTLASHAMATGALAQMAGLHRELVEQLAARAEAHAGSAGAAVALIRGDLGVVVHAQSHAEASLEVQLGQGLDGIGRLEAGLVQAIDSLRGLDARVSGGQEKLDALASAVARQREEIDAFAAHAQQQARELEAMASVLDEVNRSRFGWHLRQWFGRPAPPKKLGN